MTFIASTTRWMSLKFAVLRGPVHAPKVCNIAAP
jgi:hypothetical protein